MKTRMTKLPKKATNMQQELRKAGLDVRILETHTTSLTGKRETGFQLIVMNPDHSLFDEEEGPSIALSEEDILLVEHVARQKKLVPFISCRNQLRWTKVFGEGYKQAVNFHCYPRSLFNHLQEKIEEVKAANRETRSYLQGATAFLHLERDLEDDQQTITEFMRTAIRTSDNILQKDTIQMLDGWFWDVSQDINRFCADLGVGRQLISSYPADIEALHDLLRTLTYNVHDLQSMLNE